MFPTGKPHVSFSEVREWSECPYRHKLRHIDKIDLSKPSQHLVFGTAVHAGCEFYLKNRVLDMSVVKKEIDDAWALYGDDPNFFASAKMTKDSMLETAAKILVEIPQFLDSTFPGWECHEAEEELYESILKEDSTVQNVKFKGFIDCVLVVPTMIRGKEKKIKWILDWKTTSWGWTKEKKQDFMTKSQLVLYKNFWAAKHGVDHSEIKCGFILLKKAGKPGAHCELLPVSVGDVTSKRSLKVVNNMISGVQKGLYIKNRNSCKFCDYSGTQHCKLT